MNPQESKDDISQGLKPWLIRAVIALFIGLAIDAFVLTDGNALDNFITHYTSSAAGIIGAQLSDQVVSASDLGGGYCVNGVGLNRVFVGHACNARNILLLYVGFLVTIPYGSGRRKIKYLLLGTTGIVVFNIIRIVILFMVAAYLPAIFKLTHKFIFQLSIYALLFYLWHRYIRIYVQEPNTDLA
jgi:exosortase/archaeosortase family protein